MNVVVRLLLIWMLTLSVPMHGAASATVTLCGPSGHSEAATSIARSHGAATDSSLGRASHHHQSALTSAETADHHGATLDPTKTGSHKCSACASCCAVGALPSVVSTVPALEVPPTVFATLAPAVEAFAADGPERPPRLVLA